MATTKLKRFSIADQDHWRAKIQVAMIIETLQQHVKDPRKRKMSATQIRAAEILLKRALPELQSIEYVGNSDKPITFTWSNGTQTNDIKTIDAEAEDVTPNPDVTH